MVIGQKALLFLGDTSGFLQTVEQTLYDVIGSFDGRFYLVDEGVFSQILPSNSGEINVGEDSLSIKVDDIFRLIKS